MVTALLSFDKLYSPDFIVVQNLNLHNLSQIKKEDKLFKTTLQYFENLENKQFF